MRLATKTVLAFVLMLILTGCMVIIKNISGNHNQINKDYTDSLLDVAQEYKLEKR
jgi:starvation-inducible outer membrane lipoprotein